MSKRSKLTQGERYQIVSQYIAGNASMMSLAYNFGVDDSTIKNWLLKYEHSGFDGLADTRTQTTYTREVKYLAVQDYLSGNYSLRELVVKYSLTNKCILQQWIKKYNSHKKLKCTGKGLRTMTKARKTTLSERVEIVEYCIANKLDYQEAATKYYVSYQQVYSWTQKYKENGPEALQDNRGKRKLPEELTPEALLELKLKKLEAENNRLRAENLLLKKLEDLERRRF